ncbi:hypothetical protein R6Q57_025560 [Mikania cordata]
MAKNFTDEQLSAMKEEKLTSPFDFNRRRQRRRRRQDRSIGARDPHAFSRWKPYASTTQIHNRRGETHLSFRFQPVYRPHGETPQQRLDPTSNQIEAFKAGSGGR